MSEQAENRARLGAGDVAITLLDSSGNPEHLVLKPTYLAARTLSAQYGGLMKALERVAQLDIEVINAVITLGLGYGGSTRRGPVDLPDRIWRTGLNDNSGGLGERCVTYISVLMAGGQMPAPPEEAGADGGGPTPGE